jgi:hypothetical protein
VEAVGELDDDDGAFAGWTKEASDYSSTRLPANFAQDDFHETENSTKACAGKAHKEKSSVLGGVRDCALRHGFEDVAAAGRLARAAKRRGV